MRDNRYMKDNLGEKERDAMKLYCSDCQQWIRPVEGVTALFDRGYWWCAKCCRIAYWSKGRAVIDFPSPGKLVPETIMRNKSGDDHGTATANQMSKHIDHGTDTSAI